MNPFIKDVAKDYAILEQIELERVLTYIRLEARLNFDSRLTGRSFENFDFIEFALRWSLGVEVLWRLFRPFLVEPDAPLSDPLQHKNIIFT